MRHAARNPRDRSLDGLEVSTSMPLSSLPANASPMERSDFAYAQLRAAILDGQLRPGERLIEAEVAQRLNVSRTPVHEAVLKLIGEGLLVQAPGRGLFVPDYPLERVRQILEVRAGLEAYAARLAAPNIASEHLEELEEIDRRMEAELDAPSIERWRELNLQFHGVIHRATANPYLTELIDSIYTANMIYRRAHLRERVDRGRARAGHRAFLEALRAHDAEAAERHMRAHVLESTEVWLNESG
jgi:DNA-binding GntR family transcriptional regulator